MVAARFLLESVNILFEAINWEITLLSDNYDSSRLSISEAKYCCYYAS